MIELPKCPKCGHPAGGTISKITQFSELTVKDGMVMYSGFSIEDFETSEEVLGLNDRPMLFCGASHIGSPESEDADDFCGHEFEAPEGFVIS